MVSASRRKHRVQGAYSGSILNTESSGWGHTDGYSVSTRDSASLQDSWPRDKHDVRANSSEHIVAAECGGRWL